MEGLHAGARDNVPRLAPLYSSELLKFGALLTLRHDLSTLVRSKANAP